MVKPSRPLDVLLANASKQVPRVDSYGQLQICRPLRFCDHSYWYQLVSWDITNHLVFPHTFKIASLAAWRLQRLEAPFKVVEVKPSDIAFDIRYPLMSLLN